MDEQLSSRICWASTQNGRTVEHPHLLGNHAKWGTTEHLHLLGMHAKWKNN
jgi:hypothetical protein